MPGRRVETLFNVAFDVDDDVKGDVEKGVGPGGHCGGDTRQRDRWQPRGLWHALLWRRGMNPMNPLPGDGGRRGGRRDDTLFNGVCDVGVDVQRAVEQSASSGRSSDVDGRQRDGSQPRSGRHALVWESRRRDVPLRQWR